MQWDYESQTGTALFDTSLGHCSLPYETPTQDRGRVFGETEERLLLTAKRSGTKPDYYINKSDFGSGEIPLHAYYYPETAGGS